ncbi:hypothetical protein [Micromonospora sp. NPDC126480]|uniref:hypothetical protein n=1 Tax=Micromonospora sp. NPDC126480 TaxID=3155312 RepID=UPI0033226CB8
MEKFGRFAWLLVSATSAMAAFTACEGPQPATVEVQLRLNVCVAGGDPCFALGLPEADVSLVGVDGGGLASGTSDEAGKVVLATGGSTGEVRVVAVSPLIEGGRTESTVVLPAQGERTNITIGAGRIYSQAG